MFNQAPLGYQSLDIEGNFIEVNQTWLDTLGYTSDEVIGRWFGDFLSPEYKDEFRKRFPIFKAEGKIHTESVMVHKNGNKIFVSFIGNISNDTYGKFKQTHCILQDMTEQKLAEEKLKQSSIQWKRTFDSIQDGVVLLDAKQNIIQSNQAFLNFIDKTNEEVINSHCFSFVHNTNCPIEGCPFVRMQKSKNRETMELEINGLVCEIIVDPILDDANEIAGAVHIVKDITEHKQEEIELIKAKEKAEEGDRLKSAFLTNMSHEIRTPMNGILGFTELLKESNLSCDELQEYIQIIEISGARMVNTINSIVDMSKIESGLINLDIMETEINERMEFIYNFFKPEVERKELQFSFKNGLPSKEANIKTDNEKIYSILTNLIKNAIKFTFDGSIEFGYKKKGNYLEFYVKDTGVGIPQSKQQIIFERFMQGSELLNRGYEGSGLGLSICKSYVEMLVGKIWVESDEGLGSTFYFTIPYNPVSEERIEIIDDVSAVQLKDLKILVVDDDEVSHNLLSKMLQKNRSEILHVVTGVEAIEACRNNPDIDLVLMDIRMPVMDGLEATHQIRQFNKDVIIIAQTAYALTGDSEKALEAGCNDYISKPIKKTLLLELINKHCNK